MTQFEAVSKIVSLCEEESIDYMIVGSFSSNFFGIPRATKDADIVVQVSSEQKKRLLEKLPQEMELEPQISFEMATNTIRTLIYVPSIAFEIELFELSDDPFDQSRFDRRMNVDFNNVSICLPTPEDVIIQKLRWYKNARRDKDLEDASHVYLIQKEHLDTDYIQQWLTQHGSEEFFNSFKDLY